MGKYKSKGRGGGNPILNIGKVNAGGGGTGEEQKNEAVHTNGVSIHLIQTLMWGVAY